MNRMGRLLALLAAVWLIATITVSASEASSRESLVAQLGSDVFAERLAAEEALLEYATTDAGVHTWLRKCLEAEKDPEIRHRLRKIVLTIGDSFPTARVAFNKDALEQRIWTALSPEKGKQFAHFSMKKGGVLEYDSTKITSDSLAFVHRFTQPVEGENLRRFGPRPVPKPERFVLNAEVKILDEVHDRGGLSGMHLNLEDHRSSAGLMILKDRVFTYRSKEFHLMDTTDKWHHYRFVIEGDLQQIYIDDMDKPVFELKRSKKLGRNWATFGDCTSGGGANAQIRNVSFLRYDLPESK